MTDQLHIQRRILEIYFGRIKILIGVDIILFYFVYRSHTNRIYRLLGFYNFDANDYKPWFYKLRMADCMSVCFVINDSYPIDSDKS